MIDERKKIIIPLRRRKKKVYCKRCKWGTDRYNCTTYERVNDHISRRHRVRLHSYDKDKQNENNDCKFFRYDFFWWFR